ncbi:taste receptor type 2 member 41-like [Leptodactylus fuscus]|uniref:taste receptor type 2 member 41-like n=1 Tax=Leptodactylus fuscus TaxID=238119 RepID=UPI003F4E8E83
MKSTMKIVRFIIMVITGICGTFLNSFIVALNFRFRRDITASGSYKKLLFIIGLINIIYQGILIIKTIFETFDFDMDINGYFFIITFKFTAIGVNVWNTTWLSIFCCLCLLDSSNSFFLKIKSKFFSTVSYLFVGSVLVSMAIHFPFFWTTTLDIPQNTTEYPTISGYRLHMDYYYVIFSLLFGFSIPFFMTCVSIALSVTTLLRHVWRIRHSDSHLTSEQLQGHYRAVRTIVIRVILDILFFLVIVLGKYQTSPCLIHLHIQSSVYLSSCIQLLKLGL